MTDFRTASGINSAMRTVTARRLNTWGAQAQSVAPGFIAAASVAYAVGATIASNQTASPGFIASSSQAFSQAATVQPNLTATPGFIASGSQAYALGATIATPGSQSVSIGHIASGSQAFSLAATIQANQTVAPGHIGSGSQAYALGATIQSNLTVSPGFIASASQAFGIEPWQAIATSAALANFDGPLSSPWQGTNLAATSVAGGALSCEVASDAYALVDVGRSDYEARLDWTLPGTASGTSLFLLVRSWDYDLNGATPNSHFRIFLNAAAGTIAATYSDAEGNVPEDSSGGVRAPGWDAVHAFGAGTFAIRVRCVQDSIKLYIDGEEKLSISTVWAQTARYFGFRLEDFFAASTVSNLEFRTVNDGYQVWDSPALPAPLTRSLYNPIFDPTAAFTNGTLLYWDPKHAPSANLSSAPYPFMAYWAEDHGSGASGIRVCGADHLCGPWLLLNAGNPIYQDTALGSQTETPQVVAYEGRAYLFYHNNQSPGGTYQQSAYAVLASDGLSATRMGVILPVKTDGLGAENYGHTGYMRYCGLHEDGSMLFLSGKGWVDGGGAGEHPDGRGAWWRVYLDPEGTDGELVAEYLGELRTSWVAEQTLWAKLGTTWFFEYEGDRYLLTQETIRRSGDQFDVTDNRLMLAKIDDSRVGVCKGWVEIFELDPGTWSWETAVDAGVRGEGAIVYDGFLYYWYQCEGRTPNGRLGVAWADLTLAGRDGDRQDAAAPTLESVTITDDGTTSYVTRVFSEPVDPGDASFALAMSGGPTVETLVSGASSDTWVWSLDRRVAHDETGTDSGGGLEDPAGNALAAYSGAAVTNNSLYGSASNGLLDRVQHYWKLNAGTGASRNDSHGALTLTDANANVAQNASGQINQCAEWTATAEQGLTVASAASLQWASQSVWFAGWVRFDATGGNQVVVAKWDLSVNANREYICRFASTSSRIELVSYLSGGATDVRFTNTASISSGTWYHVAFGRDHGNSQIWISVNAGPRQTLASASGNAGSAPLNFGRLHSADNTSVLDGRLDEWGCYTGVPTAAQLSALYALTPYESFNAA